MPFRRFKRPARKNKQVPREVGESSNPPLETPTPPSNPSTEPKEKEYPSVLHFNCREWHLLERRFSTEQVCWLAFNNAARVGEFVDNVLLEEEARTPTPSPPRKASPDIDWDSLLERDSPGIELPGEELVSCRNCHTCETLGAKDDMVKCRVCGYWFHTICVGEPEQQGQEDPHFSFWRCPKCMPDPKVDPGYKFTYRSKEDIEKDKHYEDSDYECEPDYRTWL